MEVLDKIIIRLWRARLGYHRCRKISLFNNTVCAQMQAKGIKVIGLIEDREVIKKVLKQRRVWLVKKKPSARANAPPVNIRLDYSDSQIPSCKDYPYRDPEYPIEDCAS